MTESQVVSNPEGDEQAFEVNLSGSQFAADRLLRWLANATAGHFNPDILDVNTDEFVLVDDDNMRILDKISLEDDKELDALVMKLKYEPDKIDEHTLKLLGELMFGKTEELPNWDFVDPRVRTHMSVINARDAVLKIMLEKGMKLVDGSDPMVKMEDISDLLNRRIKNGVN